MTEHEVRLWLFVMTSPGYLLKNGKWIIGTWLTLCLMTGSINARSQSLVPELTFTNPRLQTGPGCAAAGEDSAVYVFSNVGYGIDALVAIRSRSSADVRLTNPDWSGPADADTDNDNAWQPRVAFRNGEAPAHRRWWMEFSISFVSHDDHSKAVQVNQFLVTGLHLGGDGKHLHEFQTYYEPAIAGADRSGTMQTSFAKGCLESRVAKGTEFAGKIAVVNEQNRPTVVNTVYRRTSHLVVRVGAETGAGSSSAAERAYAFSFRSLFFDVPEVKPSADLLLAKNWKETVWFNRCRPRAAGKIEAIDQRFSFKGYDQQRPGFSKPGLFIFGTYRNSEPLLLPPGRTAHRLRSSRNPMWTHWLATDTAGNHFSVPEHPFYRTAGGFHRHPAAARRAWFGEKSKGV
jgi:hypothetical protein